MDDVHAFKRALKSALKRAPKRAETRPEEILDAALAEFEAVGFDAARMEDIARRAALSKGAVYLYFDGKEALLEALIRRHVAPVAAQAAALALAGRAEPIAALTALAETIAPRLADRQIFAVPRLVLSVANRFPALAECYRVNVVEPVRAALESLIVAGLAQERFRAVDPETATRLFIGPLLFEAVRRHALCAAPAGDLPAIARAHFAATIALLVQEKRE